MFSPLRRAVALAAAVIVIAVVIWVDVMTPVWQNLVIIAGLVAGAVTFLLTTLFIDRFLQRAARRRWAPVTRLALTEMLHQLAADDGGDAQRRAEPHRLPIPAGTGGPQALLAGTAELRTAVRSERSRLSTALVTWWALLSSIPDTEEIIRHTADVALLFDGVRDASLALDQAVTSGAKANETEAAERSLRSQIMACNHSIAGIVEEISARLAQDQTELSGKAEQTLAAMHRRVAHE
ncbi:hypothetical protein [Ruania zhangjianzhongii]|uniref:hypothetical protein n=1 Tax=Ruania zhangjianzhongii TaxID=2603206 RepID=UPI0011CA42C6|nr:hypothetical protein [Ruania zhangjianzhongii]